MQMTTTHFSSLSYWAGNSESKFMVEKNRESERSESQTKGMQCSLLDIDFSKGKKRRTRHIYWL